MKEMPASISPRACFDSLAQTAARAARKTLFEAQVAWQFGRLGRPEVALYFGIGFGDDLLCTTVARELRARGQKGLWMLSDHPELFQGNPDFSAVQACTERARFLLGRAAARLIEPAYCTRAAEGDSDSSPRRHILAEMCATAGLTGRVALRPYLHLSPREKRFGRFSERQVAIQSSGGSAAHAMRNKEWLPGRFAEVVDRLQGEFDFVQIGSAQDPLLPGVRDLRGQTTVRETAAVLHHSRLFVGLVGFPMHLARAMECRSVIVYGGREAPWQSGYVANRNLATTHLPCAPCWQWFTCDFDHACMKAIVADDVIAAIRESGLAAARPLATEYAELPPLAPS